MLVATGSMDGRCILWDVEKGKPIYLLMGHTDTIVSINFNTDGDKIMTSSFDGTAKIWDVCSGELIHTLGIDKNSKQFESQDIAQQYA